MTFKEAVQDDVKGVFLNPEEFGEMHRLNHKEVLIIIDENELTEREKRMKGVDEELHSRQLLFYVAAKDVGPLPSPGKVLTLDGRDYLITDAQSECGIYSISLEARRS